MDKVFINQLQIDTVIGIYDWEKEMQQRLFLDLEMEWDISQAAATDNYHHALCYETVSRRLIELVTAKPIELIETVAEMVANCLLSEFKVSKVTVRVNKPDAVKQAANVGIEITRSK